MNCKIQNVFSQARFVFSAMLVALVLSVLMGCNNPSDDASNGGKLDGTWVWDMSPVVEYKFNNGNFEYYSSGTISSKGTYTTSDHNITTTVVYHGISGLCGHPEYDGLYNRTEMEAVIRAAVASCGTLSEDDIQVSLDMYFQTLTYPYSVSGNTLTLGNATFTRK